MCKRPLRSSSITAYYHTKHDLAICVNQDVLEITLIPGLSLRNMISVITEMNSSVIEKYDQGLDMWKTCEHCVYKLFLNLHHLTDKLQLQGGGNKL